jgi:hypothetical protein
VEGILVSVDQRTQSLCEEHLGKIKGMKMLA